MFAPWKYNTFAKLVEITAAWHLEVTKRKWKQQVACIDNIIHTIHRKSLKRCSMFW